MLFRQATSSAARSALRISRATGARFASSSSSASASTRAGISPHWASVATVALAGTGLYLTASPAVHLEGRQNYADRISKALAEASFAQPQPEAPQEKEEEEEDAKEAAREEPAHAEQGEALEAAADGIDSELVTLASEAEAALDEDPRGAAFDPRTGEINWDCPCLGGMAHGPCGEEFKLAFSCFVFSEAEPKGIDCVEKFQAMQTCFRKYPEAYAEEIADDEEAARQVEAESKAEAEGKADA